MKKKKNEIVLYTCLLMAIVMNVIIIPSGTILLHRWNHSLT